MTYFFHPDAELELNVSVDYYEECKKNLGSEFAYEVHTLKGHPEKQSKEYYNFRLLGKH